MAEFLVGILYYEPEPRSLWEQGVIEDYESSTGLFIEADSPESAIAWGEHVGQSLLRFVNDDSTLDWKTLGNWCWLEESPHTCNWKHCLDFFQHVRVGEMPDLDRMTSNAYGRWLEENWIPERDLKSKATKWSGAWWADQLRDLVEAIASFLPT